MNTEKFEIVWSEEYEMGNTFVDSQHKRLFELVDKVTKSCLDEDTTILSETLDFLLQYTVQHFADEESLQISCNFPEYEQHKKLHEEFEKTVSKKVAEFREKGSTKDLSDAINNFVVGWLVNHILKEDMKIGAYLNS